MSESVWQRREKRDGPRSGKLPFFPKFCAVKKLSKNLLLVGNFVSRSAKFEIETYVLENVGAKLKF